MKLNKSIGMFMAIALTTSSVSTVFAADSDLITKAKKLAPTKQQKDAAISLINDASEVTKTAAITSYRVLKAAAYKVLIESLKLNVETAKIAHSEGLVDHDNAKVYIPVGKDLLIIGLSGLVGYKVPSLLNSTTSSSLSSSIKSIQKDMSKVIKDQNKLTKALKKVNKADSSAVKSNKIESIKLQMEVNRTALANLEKSVGQKMLVQATLKQARIKNKVKATASAVSRVAVISAATLAITSSVYSAASVIALEFDDTQQIQDLINTLIEEEEENQTQLDALLSVQ